MLFRSAGAQFEVVSIKLNTSGDIGATMQTLPDGGFRASNIRIRQIMNAAAPEPVVDFIGLPDWVLNDRYDIFARPAPDSHPTHAQSNEMMRNMLIDRMKLVGHVKEEERPGFALVVARSDGRLGPDLKTSDLDCGGADKEKCGGRMGSGLIDYHGVRIDQFVQSIRGQAGGVVINRTGLEGWYDLKLRYSVRPLNADPSAPTDDAPQLLTALQEQLGLKLVPEKTKVKIFVIDQIERPTPN